MILTSKFYKAFVFYWKLFDFGSMMYSNQCLKRRVIELRFDLTSDQ